MIDGLTANTEVIFKRRLLKVLFSDVERPYEREIFFRVIRTIDFEFVSEEFSPNPGFLSMMQYQLRFIHMFAVAIINHILDDFVIN